MMFRYIKKYPVSLVAILVILFLSFLKPSSTSELTTIPHLDKVAHMGMYFLLSAVLWWEFFRSHKKGTPVYRAWVGAFLCPVLFSGAVEILQEYCTSYRGGDWFDFLANFTGALLASLIGHYVLRGKVARS